MELNLPFFTSVLHNFFLVAYVSLAIEPQKLEMMT